MEIPGLYSGRDIGIVNRKKDALKKRKSIFFIGRIVKSEFVTIDITNEFQYNEFVIIKVTNLL